MNETILNVIISHQERPCLEAMVRWWNHLFPGIRGVIAFGGNGEVGEDVHGWPVIPVDDPQLRVRDLQRDRQSYLGVMRAVRDATRADDHDWVNLAEYDQVPLHAQVLRVHLHGMENEEADVSGVRLLDVTESSYPHYLSHIADPLFEKYLDAISSRRRSRRVLAVMGCGTFWRREAFDAVAGAEPPMPVYLEIGLPTFAHHLGFRVRPFDPSQECFFKYSGDLTHEIGRARREGAHYLHPCKSLWKQLATVPTA